MINYLMTQAVALALAGCIFYVGISVLIIAVGVAG